MDTRKRRVGVLTGGRDCPGLNAVIRAVVRTVQSEGPGIELIGDPPTRGHGPGFLGPG